MSARTRLVAYLRDTLPATFDVRGYLRELDGVPVGKTVVMVEVSTLERTEPPSIGRPLWAANTSVVIVTGLTAVEQVEDDLDSALETVILALGDYPESIDADAERAVVGALQGYRINLQIPFFFGEEM